MDYGDGTSAENREQNNVNLKIDKDIDAKEKLEKSNIETSFHCRGALLTFSFHVIEQDKIRCYFSWNGQGISFMPEDILTILPIIFNMESEKYDNNDFIKDKDEERGAIGVIKRIKGIIKDRDFINFRTCCSS